MSYDHAWMRYHIADGADQRLRVAELISKAKRIGCEASSERAPGYIAVDVWIPSDLDPAWANVALYMATQEAPTYDAPALE